jgi:hypothetical protein
VAEAERFGHICDAVAEALDNPNAQTIHRLVIDLVVNWVRISCVMPAWVRYGRTQASLDGNIEATKIRRLGIVSPAEALSTIGPILLGRRGT